MIYSNLSKSMEKTKFKIYEAPSCLEGLLNILFHGLNFLIGIFYLLIYSLGILAILFVLVYGIFLTMLGLVLAIMSPSLLIEGLIIKKLDETCLTEANRKKLLKEFITTIINMVPTNKDEECQFTDPFQPYEEYNGQNELDQYLAEGETKENIKNLLKNQTYEDQKLSLYFELVDTKLIESNIIKVLDEEGYLRKAG